MSMIHIYDNFIPEINLKNLNRDLTFVMPWYFAMDGKFDTESKQPLSLGCFRTRENFGSIENYLIQVLNRRGINTSVSYTHLTLPTNREV